MKFDDSVYGKKTVSEPVLQELIRSAPVQRLKHINQAGPQEYFMDEPRPVTRFQHSVGVMLLLREHGATMEEQIAGLLHDVPHTAFSHVADFVFQDDDYEYHEQFMEKIVYSSDIPNILERHGFDTDTVLDESRHGLLERDLPDLCADRIDYFFRDMTVCAGEDVSVFQNALSVYNGRFILTDVDIAEKYALDFISADERYWANPTEIAIFEVFADAIRAALESGTLTEDDLFGTDEEVWQQLQDTDVPAVRKPLERLSGGIDIDLGADDPDLVATTKARYVDPLVVNRDEEFRISDRSETVRQRIHEHREHIEGGYRINIIE